MRHRKQRRTVMTPEIETIDTPEVQKLNGAPAKPPEQEHPPETYRLSDAERQTVLQAVSYENSIKIRLCDLRTELESVEKEALSAAGQRRGAVAMLVKSRNWQDGFLSEDLATLTKREPPPRLF